MRFYSKRSLHDPFSLSPPTAWQTGKSHVGSWLRSSWRVWHYPFIAIIVGHYHLTAERAPCDDHSWAQSALKDGRAVSPTFRASLNVPRPFDWPSVRLALTRTEMTPAHLLPLRLFLLAAAHDGRLHCVLHQPSRLLLTSFSPFSPVCLAFLLSEVVRFVASRYVSDWLSLTPSSDTVCYGREDSSGTRATHGSRWGAPGQVELCVGLSSEAGVV